VDFTKITAFAARAQPIAGNWSAFGAFTGQYAFNSVLSSELFSYGGDQFGRGHDPSELVGDHGAAIKLELRYSGGLPLASGGNYTAYGFYDHGQVRQRDAGGLKAVESGASFGFGLRFAIGPYVTGSIEAAKPVIRVVAAEGNQDTRFYGSIAVRF
jgi:hemolysin activation/secretion protein